LFHGGTKKGGDETSLNTPLKSEAVEKRGKTGAYPDVCLGLSPRRVGCGRFEHDSAKLCLNQIFRKLQENKGD
jgi:hypothetical protein